MGIARFTTPNAADMRYKKFQNGRRAPLRLSAATLDICIPSTGLNSKIATVQKRACGYRNPDHFKIAVYFHCGGLNPYPTRLP